MHWVEWNYNTTLHSTTGLSPFEVVYGKKPSTIPHSEFSDVVVEAVQSTLSERDVMLAKLRGKLLKAQERMKTMIDKHRREVEFKEGCWMYMKLRPYRQQFVA